MDCLQFISANCTACAAGHVTNAHLKMSPANLKLGIWIHNRLGPVFTCVNTQWPQLVAKVKDGKRGHSTRVPHKKALVVNSIEI